MRRHDDEQRDAAAEAHAATGATAHPVLALQRTAGNAAVAQLMRREVPAHLHLLDPQETSFELLPDDPVPTAIERLTAALGATTGEPAWDFVVRLVRDPKPRPVPRGLPAALTSRSVLHPLTVLRAEDRPRVLDAVFAHLLANREGAAAPDLAAEWEELKPVHHHFNQPNPAFYATVRPALLAEFGALDAGSATALERVLAYYGTHIVQGTFLGKRAPMHRELAAALKVAEALIPDPKPALQSMGGLSIRSNANNALALSEHSFGAAVDLNAETSPNTKLPTAFVAGITGVDVDLDPQGRRKSRNMLDDVAVSSHPDSLAAVEAIAARLHDASDKLAAAFADEEGLAAAMFDIASRRGAPAGRPEELIALVFAAAREGDKVDWRYEPVESQPFSVQPPKGVKPRPRGLAHEELARFIFPAEGTDRSFGAGVARETVELLTLMATTYQQSFTKRGRVGPTARSPSLAQLGVHGFDSIPPPVVAGLSGAGLRWLGTMAGVTKDYMHFELEDRPSLY